MGNFGMVGVKNLKNNKCLKFGYRRMRGIWVILFDVTETINKKMDRRINAENLKTIGTKKARKKCKRI